MRMSCNGCRVLRKGCSETCTIRPCLQWIKDPESQANATLFLAKFYGRAGFMNLINNGPDHLRPAIFRSLLYEACGRIVNPTYGSVGLLWSGSWEMCQAAVEAVLKGSPIVPMASDDAAATQVPQLKAYDIRHVTKNSPASRISGAELHKVGAKSARRRFKRPAGGAPATRADPVEQELCGRPNWPAGSHESSGNESGFSVEAASHVSQGEPDHDQDGGLLELDLTLGLEPAGARSGAGHSARSPIVDAARRDTPCSWGDDTARMGIGLKLGA